MINNDIISTKLRVYEEAYDYYIEHRQMPNTMPPDDMLVDFMKRVIDENPQIESIDPLWNDILKEEIMKFIVAMLKFFERAESTYQKEKKLIQLFSEGNKEKKRELWAEAYQTIKNQYDPEEVNIEGYIQQFKTNDAESVFGPLIEDWDRACDNRLKNLQKKYIQNYQKDWKQGIRTCGDKDYKKRKKWDRMYASYPEMVEIVQILGRDQPNQNKEKDETIRRYLPLLPSPPTPAVEIEEITNGNNLQHLLPIETAILSDHQTESLFYYKYAMSQLQLFANKPKLESVMKVEQTKKKEPRLEKGPIIVSIDTSGSMDGHPIKLATCLLMQLLLLARKQKRHCFLISFSVEAQYLDLSLPGTWSKLEQFLSDSYSGGTDGNEMLKAGIMMLKSDNYAMADMLVISDFFFDLPNFQVMKAMQEEHEKGTRFYGLQIGRGDCEYDTILDKVWKI